MGEAQFATVGRPIPYVCPPRLKIFRIANRANFQPLLAPSRPNLNVIGFSHSKANVAACQFQHPIAKTKGIANIHGVLPHLLDHLIAFVRVGKLVHFHLVKLVAALDAAHIFARAHLLSPEAGGVRHIAQRQIGFVQDFVAVDVGQGNFGRSQKHKIFFRIPINVIEKLGKLACPFKNLRPHHVGQPHLHVTVVVNMGVEHILDYRSLEPCPPAAQHVKAAAA